MTNIGREIRRARVKAKLTQQQLSEASGVPRTMISSYERGRYEPSFFAAECLLNALGYRLEIVKNERIIQHCDRAYRATAVRGGDIPTQKNKQAVGKDSNARMEKHEVKKKC